jgi:hypothetical protein
MEQYNWLQKWGLHYDQDSHVENFKLERPNDKVFNMTIFFALRKFSGGQVLDNIKSMDIKLSLHKTPT